MKLKWMATLLAVLIGSGQALAERQPDLDAARQRINATLEQVNPDDLQPLDQVATQLQQIQQLDGGLKLDLNLDGLPAVDADTLQRMQREVAALLEQPEAAAQQAQTATRQPYADGPLVLVSFSMPEGQLISLAADAARIGATLVFRGLVDNDLMTTSGRIRQLVDGMDDGLAERLSLAVDPTLYRRFGVALVPSLVVPAEPVQPCDDTGCPVPVFARVAGSASLDYLLAVIEREAASPLVMARATDYRQRLDLEVRP